MLKRKRFPVRGTLARCVSLGLQRRSYWLAGIALSGLLSACGGDGPTGIAAEGCGPLPYFTTLPVALADVDFIAVVGGLGAPGHTLPTAHAGFLLKTEGASVFAPGDIQVSNVRRVTYLQSPNRQGERDYALFFSVCKDVEGWLGHLTTLAPGIPDNAAGSNCQTYSTALETVESCTENLSGFTLSAGQPIGTGGLSIEHGLMGLDFGLLDFRVDNFYVTPSRHPQNSFHAVCPYDYFDPTNRQALLARIRDGSRPNEVLTGEPRCGTMEVDVAGTAKGVWAEQGVTGQVQGDETRYITLANYPYNPQQKLALSLGPVALGARVAVVQRETSGRVNRAFEQVAGDGLAYCYNTTDPSDFGFGSSWLVSLASSGTLRMEWIQHPGTPGPCVADPTTWQFGAAAMSFVR